MSKEKKQIIDLQLKVADLEKDMDDIEEKVGELEKKIVSNVRINKRVGIIEKAHESLVQKVEALHYKPEPKTEEQITQEEPSPDADTDPV